MKRLEIKVNETLKLETLKQFKVVESNGVFQVVRMYFTPSYKERVYSSHVVKEQAENAIKERYQYS